MINISRILKSRAVDLKNVTEELVEKLEEIYQEEEERENRKEKN